MARELEDFELWVPWSGDVCVCVSFFLVCALFVCCLVCFFLFSCFGFGHGVFFVIFLSFAVFLCVFVTVLFLLIRFWFLVLKQRNQEALQPEDGSRDVTGQPGDADFWAQLQSKSQESRMAQEFTESQLGLCVQSKLISSDIA